MLGCGGGSGGIEVDPARLDVDRCLRQAITKEEQRQSKQIALLLIGAGESGKSTLLKQMNLIGNGGTLSQDVRSRFVGAIHSK